MPTTCTCPSPSKPPELLHCNHLCVSCALKLHVLWVQSSPGRLGKVGMQCKHSAMSLLHQHSMRHTNIRSCGQTCLDLQSLHVSRTAVCAWSLSSFLFVTLTTLIACNAHIMPEQHTLSVQTNKKIGGCHCTRIWCCSRGRCPEVETPGTRTSLHHTR